MENFTINCFLLVLTLIFAVIVIDIAYLKVNEMAALSNYNEKIDEKLSKILIWNEMKTNNFEATNKNDAIEYNWIDHWEYEETFNCGMHKCLITNIREYLPTPNMYDAILFNIEEEVTEMTSLILSRKPKQLYILTSWKQAPVDRPIQALNSKAEFYNLTMSYRFDSDLVLSRRKLVEIETGYVMAPTQHTFWRQPPLKWEDSNIKKLWSHKNRIIAWHVDNCKSLSKREKLVEDLSRYIHIFVYGKCGSESAKGNLTFGAILATQYKFLLAFEHCFCDDYVTEPVYFALENNVIPIVYGGADYLRFLPPMSFINVEDFKSVDLLAKYLQELARDKTRYMRYFWWRQYYKIVATSPFCDLCEILHSGNAIFKTQIYKNITQWWLRGCRKEPKIKFTDQ